MGSRSALLLIDIQVDFCPGGALAVNEGDTIIGPLNGLIGKCREKEISIFATRDWHPEDHSSFKKNGGIWPVYCVQDSHGARFIESQNWEESLY